MSVAMNTPVAFLYKRNKTTKMLVRIATGASKKSVLVMDNASNMYPQGVSRSVITPIKILHKVNLQKTGHVG